MLFAVRRSSLFAVCRWRLPDCCFCVVRLRFDVCCLLFVVLCLLFVVCRVLFVVCCCFGGVLFVVCVSCRCVLIVVCKVSLFVECRRLLSVAYCVVRGGGCSVFVV